MKVVLCLVLIMYELGRRLIDLDGKLDENVKRQKLGILNAVYSIDRHICLDRLCRLQNPFLEAAYQVVCNSLCTWSTGVSLTVD